MQTLQLIVHNVILVEITIILLQIVIHVITEITNQQEIQIMLQMDFQPTVLLVIPQIRDGDLPHLITTISIRW